MPQFMPMGGFGGGSMAPNPWLMILQHLGQGMKGLGGMMAPGGMQNVSTQGDKSGLLGIASAAQPRPNVTAAGGPPIPGADASLMHMPGPVTDSWPRMQTMGQGQPLSGFRGVHPMMPGGQRMGGK